VANQVRECPDSVCHDGENVVERLPGLCQLENSEQTKRAQNRKTADAVREKLDQRQQDDDEVKDVPAVLLKIKVIVVLY
jgi:hypothetical protein